MGYTYDLTEGPPAIWYDSSNTIVIKIKNPIKVQFKLIRAVADPITRFFLAIVGNAIKEPASLLIIYQLNKQNENKVKNIILRLLNKLSSKPWELKKHPMFTRAPLMRLMVKKRWMRWIG